MRCLLALVLLASAPAHAAKTRGCGDPDTDVRRLADGSDATRSPNVALEGYEILVPIARGMTLPPGAICEVRSRKELTGVAALQAALAASPDPYVLAVVAMATLESGVAGKLPWRTTDGAGPSVGTDPALEGGELRYWRHHAQQGDWVLVRVDVATGAANAQLERDVVASGEAP